MARIPQNVLDDIINRVDIVEIIGSYIPLKKAGRNYKAACPFHHEKTPSFMVSPDKQIYHCFGCSAGGNAFNFLMQYEHMDFHETVEVLAKKAGVILPQYSPSSTQTTQTIFYKINELTCNFYHNLLKSPDAKAKDVQVYLNKRGINQATQEIFKLGLSPSRSDALIRFLRAKNFSLGFLEKAGLILSLSRGGFADRFRGRLIFPIFDVKSRVIAFGGRFLKSDADSGHNVELAKYINSPQTPIYTKGRHVYGLNFAKEAIRKLDFCVVVEGYLDFISPYQAGFKNVVASLGTSLTVEQIRLLKRYTHNIIMVYDSDTAGEEATLRSLNILVEEEMNTKIAVLPEGFDPDLFVRSHGIEKFRTLVGEAQDILKYKLEILSKQYNLNEPFEKLRLCQEILATLGRFKNSLIVSEYIKRLAESLQVKEEILHLELRKMKEKPLFKIRFSGEQKEKMPVNSAERLLLQLLLHNANLIEEASNELNFSDFQDKKIAQVFSHLSDLAKEGKFIETHHLMTYFKEPETIDLIAGLMLDKDLPQDKLDRIFNDCIKRIKRQRQILLRLSLQEKIKEAQKNQDEIKLQGLVREFQELVRSK